MRLTPEGLEHLVAAEGLRLDPYQDVAGLWTIGVGHLLTAEERATGKVSINGVLVPWKRGLSRDAVLILLQQDVRWAERAVRDAVTVPLTPHQFDALVSFVFNVGTGAFRSSTLLKKLNAGDYADVPTQLMRWVHAGGRRIPGLVARRQAEIRLWQHTKEEA